MKYSVFGRKFVVKTSGESHGPYYEIVVKIPTKMKISERRVQEELNKRRPGYSVISTKRKEPDKIVILSGIEKGRTTGGEIKMRVYNLDAKSKDYNTTTIRPGTMDFTQWKKYGKIPPGGGKVSGRETLCRVAAGAIAKAFLREKGINVLAFSKEIGGISTKFDSGKINSKNFGKIYKEVYKNVIRCPDKNAAKKMQNRILEVAKRGDSIGGIIETVAVGVPPGLGEPVFDKLNADIAKALSSIPAVVGVEKGIGFKCAKLLGSQNNDQLTKKGFLSNNAGGILGGISTGQPIVYRLAIKPTPSISKPQKTIDIYGKELNYVVRGRHDPCIVPRAVPVVEAMMAITLADHYLRTKDK